MSLAPLDSESISMTKCSKPPEARASRPWLHAALSLLSPFARLLRRLERFAIESICQPGSYVLARRFHA